MSEHAILFFVLFPLAAYAMGSVPFGVLIARAHGVDLRKVGSGNVGATNVGRILGRKWGYLCFLLDVLKGFAPVLTAGLLLRGQEGFPSELHQVAWLSVAFAAVLGHVFSIFLKFRGGKGVATSLGVVLGVFPYFTWPGLAAFGLWIVVTLVSRYVSVGSIVSALAFLPLFAAFNWSRMTKLWPLGVFAAAVVLLILLRHRGNVRRLLAGEENKIGRKSSSEPAAR